jgi:hypothetical protein
MDVILLIGCVRLSIISAFALFQVVDLSLQVAPG